MTQIVVSQNQNYNKISTAQFLYLIRNDNTISNNEFLRAIYNKNSLNN